MAIHLLSKQKLAAAPASGLLALGLCAVGASPAVAATTIDGPIDLGAASTFGVLGASAVTNTGPTIVDGDVGVSPGTSITGFEGPPAGLVNGTLHATDAVAAQAQVDLTDAINDAASLSPTTSGLSNLSGLSLTPGVYSGGALSLDGGGLLTLAGTADSIWVFQAASTLTVGSAAQIQMTGGASSCNVFWQIGSSATIGTSAQFVGTVMAGAAITANTGATIQGRLLANGTAVTLDTNLITVPTGCAPGSEPVETDSPEFTSPPPPDATVGTPYSFTVTASGTPAPTFAVTAGALPAGLTLSPTGTISGTPTTAGTSTATVTATNGIAPDASTVITIDTAAAAVVPPIPVVPAPPLPENPAPPVPEIPTAPGIGAETTPVAEVTTGRVAAPAPTTAAGVEARTRALPATAVGANAPLVTAAGGALLLAGLLLLAAARAKRARA